MKSVAEVAMITDTADAKRMAVYHGVFDTMSQTLKNMVGSGMVFTIRQDGKVFCLFAGWANFENEIDNGWMCMVSDSEQIIQRHAMLLKSMMDEEAQVITVTNPANN